MWLLLRVSLVHFGGRGPDVAIIAGIGTWPRCGDYFGYRLSILGEGSKWTNNSKNYLQISMLIHYFALSYNGYLSIILAVVYGKLIYRYFCNDIDS